MQYLYHYTYRITNIKLNKHYYGVRSSKTEPKLDLGIKYFSSSTDNEFQLDQKLNHQDYKYKIVRIYDTRKEAVDLEIKLHHKFNVGVNENFYNKAIQTSNGFDNTGRPHSDETKERMSIARRGENHPMFGITGENHYNFGRTHSSETKEKMSASMSGENNHMFGRTHSEETKEKISKANSGENHPMFGRTLTEEHREKISKANSGENHHMFGRTGENNPLFGRTHSSETKEKMSAAKKGIPQPKRECKCCGELIAVPHHNRHYAKCILKFPLDIQETELESF